MPGWLTSKAAPDVVIGKSFRRSYYCLLFSDLQQHLIPYPTKKKQTNEKVRLVPSNESWKETLLCWNNWNTSHDTNFYLIFSASRECWKINKVQWIDWPPPCWRSEANGWNFIWLFQIWETFQRNSAKHLKIPRRASQYAHFCTFSSKIYLGFTFLIRSQPKTWQMYFFFAIQVLGKLFVGR